MKTKKAQLTPSWDLIPASFKLLKLHLVSVMYLVLIPSLVLALGSLWLGPMDSSGKPMASDSKELGLIVMAVGLAWSLINVGPVVLLELRAAQKKTLSLRELYAQGLRFNLKLYAAYIIYAVLVVVGLLLFIVPGLIMLRRYFLVGYYIVDRNMGIVEALKQSAKESKPVSGWVWGIIGVQLAFSICAGFFQGFGAVGIILGQLVVLTVIFLPALRYLEVPKQTA